MAVTVRTRTDRAGDLSGTVYELTCGRATAEIWPFAGFNCLRWAIDGRDVLYSAADWSTNPVPTRSGIPILFPFPNRLAKGQLTANGVDYQLPLTEATKTHAIHGFTARSPWTVVGSGMTDQSAFVTARFRMSERFENAASLWPGDGSLTLTYTLTESGLRAEAEVENAGTADMPYGLGYHGYFRPPVADRDESLDGWLFQCDMDQQWECVSNMPTGRMVTIPPEFDFRNEKRIGQTAFDTLFSRTSAPAGLTSMSTLRHPDRPGRLEIRADGTFSQIVLFTPTHRKAIAIEPYTCATDAAHMPAPVPSGWRILAPGGKVNHRVEYFWKD